MKTLSNIKTCYFIILLGLIMYSGKTFAQTVPPEERAKNLTMSMNCEIGLFHDQIPKVNAINLEAAKRMDSAKNVSGSDMKKYQNAGKLISENRSIKLRDVLTPEQWSKYDRISRGNKTALKKTAYCRKDLNEE
jgi:hypothetical protein